MGVTPGGLGLPTAIVYWGCLTMLMFDWAMPTTLIRVVGGAGGGGGGGGVGGGWAR